jgi:hypothetical protein
MFDHRNGVFKNERTANRFWVCPAPLVLLGMACFYAHSPDYRLLLFRKKTI